MNTTLPATMTDSQLTILEAVHVVSPVVLERARRLEFAVRLLRTGTTRREAARLLRERYGCSQPSAWRLVDVAADLSILEPNKETGT